VKKEYEEKQRKKKDKKKVKEDSNDKDKGKDEDRKADQDNDKELEKERDDKACDNTIPIQFWHILTSLQIKSLRAGESPEPKDEDMPRFYSLHKYATVAYSKYSVAFQLLLGYWLT
jgi:hypothetical protein